MTPHRGKARPVRWGPEGAGGEQIRFAPRRAPGRFAARSEHSGPSRDDAGPPASRKLFAAVRNAFLALAASTAVALAQDVPPDPKPAPPASDSAPEAGVTADDASLTAEVGDDGGRIVLEARGVRPKAPLFFSAEAVETVNVQGGSIDYEIGVNLKVLQGKARQLSLGLGGSGELQSVSGEGLVAWSVRRVGKERYLDLEVDPAENRKELKVVVRGRIAKLAVPSTPDLLHLMAGKAVGFTSTVNVTIPAELSVRLAAAEGFLPLESTNENLKRFEGALGTRLAFAFTRSTAVSAPVELRNAWLEGTVDEKGGFTSFLLRGTAEVTKDDAVMSLLRGRAAASEVPAGAGYQLELIAGPGQEPLYQLRFPKAGSFPVEINIVARHAQSAEWKNLSFEIPSGAILPIVLRGIAGQSEFRQDAGVIPSQEGEAWRGFLPLTGHCEVGWKPVRKTGEGKLFFTTSGLVNVGVGAGLLRQTSLVRHKILQGQLKAITINLEGPGEVLEVTGENVLGWNVETEEGARRLEVRLSRPVENSSVLRVRSQLALGAFPVRAKPLRLEPAGSIRHSGNVRVYNIGATRLEVAGVTGLTQLAPDQFPEKDLPGGDRQTFVYRFPAAAHEYEIAADRVQPEVTVSQIVVYELSESDRMIESSLELDIREAPLREWNLFIPADYSVVSVSGAEVADYVKGTQVENEERTLKVLFAKEVMGRQLIRVHLEKNQAAESGPWVLLRLRNPEAKTERGEIGVASVPGFRLAVTASDKLTEIPISRFQNSRADLQQTFRIRERDWSATLNIESLPQSVQADVFHLYSLKDQTAYASVVVNYFITGAPVSVWKLGIPVSAGNVSVEGKDVRQWRREGEGGTELVVSLHQPVIGPFTLLVTYEEPVGAHGGMITPGQVEPKNVRGERGFIQVVSPVQVDAAVTDVSPSLLKLDPLELPAEFRLLSAAPSLATYQYTARPFTFSMAVDWFESGDTVPQVVEFVEAHSRVSRDGEVVTDVTMMVKTRGRRVLRTALPQGSRLWEVAVNGQAVSARTDVKKDPNGNPYTLIPLASGADANAQVEVHLRLGKPAKDAKFPVLTLPALAAPVLNTVWKIEGEQGRVLLPRKNQLPLTEPILTETGLEWIANRATGATAIMFVLLAVGLWVRCGGSRNIWIGLGGIGLLVAALIVSLLVMRDAGAHQRGNLEVLEFTLPVIAAGQQPSMVVGNYSEWGAKVSIWGILAVVAGVALIGLSLFTKERRALYRLGGGVLLAVGLLAQGGGAVAFYLIAAIVIVLLLLPWIVRWWGQMRRTLEVWSEEKEREAAKRAEKESESDGSVPGPSAASLLAFGLILSLGGLSEADAQNKGKPAPPVVIPAGMLAADSLVQEWSLEEGRLKASGTLRVTGKPGDTYLLLRAPGVLTKFEGARLRVSRRDVAGAGSSYVVSIRGVAGEEAPAPGGAESFDGSFSFEMQVGERVDRILVPTGPASVQQIKVQYDQSGWEFDSAAAMRVTKVAGLLEGQSGAELLLAPLGAAEIVRRPKARDVKAEKTQFFAEVANLFLPSPGVIDGFHRLGVRPSQGEVSELSLTIPEGFTVSEVSGGPVGEWQFDADTRVLKVVVEPAQANPFSLLVETQGSLAPLPADAALAPVAVAGAAGEVGLVALAFGAEAQPEKTDLEGLSAVNLTDFDANMIPERGGAKPVLHRVFRYGQGGGSLALRVAPVAPEIRVTSKQVLSIGDERLVLGVNFVVDITRAGLFQMSFPLPEGLEVDSLSGPALSHWTELTEDGTRFVILHLNGKTIGKQQFSLSLSGAAPGPSEDVAGWLVPRFELREAQRHTGDLVVKPTKGIRLEANPLSNVSDVDPREVGGQGEGALAFRILQADWELSLGIEKLDPWVTGQILHEITLREGQTRTTLAANLKVENASIRSLRIRVPGLSEEEEKTLRASGGSVNDMAKVAREEDLWEMQFKRRIIGGLNLQIEWERTGEREKGRETMTMATFPELRQTSYYFAVRAGARLELETDSLPKGWQRVDWNAVPQSLRESGDRSIPALTIRSVPPENSLGLLVRRHSVAEALKLRVARGLFSTVISPVGEQLTAVELSFEVIQRSTLRVHLPKGGVLFNVFVNGESVSIVREEQAYRFYILPGADDRSANVSFVYSMPGQKLARLKLASPKLNVPLENIDWRVIVPADFELVKHDGDLDFREDRFGEQYDMSRYLVRTDERRQKQRQLAEDSLERANELLNAGEQTKARLLLNSAANNYALDAASNEDARVQLTKLQTQQAIVGLNTRRQRLYLDNKADDPGFQQNAQLERAATRNPIVNRGETRFRPQEYSQFLEGNTEDDNAVLRRIATQLVAHQRSTEPAPQAISVTIPDQGRIFTFSRSVQVEEGAPLTLGLKFESPRLRSTSKEAFVLILIFGICVALVFGWKQKTVQNQA